MPIYTDLPELPAPQGPILPEPLTPDEENDVMQHWVGLKDEIASADWFKKLDPEAQKTTFGNYQTQFAQVVDVLRSRGMSEKNYGVAAQVIDTFGKEMGLRIEKQDFPLNQEEVLDIFKARPGFKDLDDGKRLEAIQKYGQFMELLQSEEFKSGKVSIAKQLGLKDTALLSGITDYDWSGLEKATRAAQTDTGLGTLNAAIESGGRSAASMFGFLGETYRGYFVDPTPDGYDKSDTNQVALAAALQDARREAYGEKAPWTSAISSGAGSFLGFGAAGKVASGVLKLGKLEGALEAARKVGDLQKVAQITAQLSKAGSKVNLLTAGIAGTGLTASEHGTIDTFTTGKGIADLGINVSSIALSEYLGDKTRDVLVGVIAPKVWKQLKYMPKVQSAFTAAAGGGGEVLSDVAQEAIEGFYDTIGTNKKFATEFENRMKGQLDYATGEREGGYGLKEFATSFGLGAAAGSMRNYRRARGYVAMLDGASHELDNIAWRAEREKWSPETQTEAQKMFLSGLFGKEGGKNLTDEEYNGIIEDVSTYNEFYSKTQAARPALDEAARLFRQQQDLAAQGMQQAAAESGAAAQAQLNTAAEILDQVLAEQKPVTPEAVTPATPEAVPVVAPVPVAAPVTGEDFAAQDSIRRREIALAQAELLEAERAAGIPPVHPEPPFKRNIETGHWTVKAQEGFRYSGSEFDADGNLVSVTLAHPAGPVEKLTGDDAFGVALQEANSRAATSQEVNAEIIQQIAARHHTFAATQPPGTLVLSSDQAYSGLGGIIDIVERIASVYEGRATETESRLAAIPREVLVEAKRKLDEHAQKLKSSPAVNAPELLAPLEIMQKFLNARLYAIAPRPPAPVGTAAEPTAPAAEPVRTPAVAEPVAPPVSPSPAGPVQPAAVRTETPAQPSPVQNDYVVGQTRSIVTAGGDTLTATITEVGDNWYTWSAEGRSGTNIIDMNRVVTPQPKAAAPAAKPVTPAPVVAPAAPVAAAPVSETTPTTIEPTISAEELLQREAELDGLLTVGTQVRDLKGNLWNVTGRRVARNGRKTVTLRKAFRFGDDTSAFERDVLLTNYSAEFVPPAPKAAAAAPKPAPKAEAPQTPLPPTPPSVVDRATATQHAIARGVVDAVKAERAKAKGKKKKPLSAKEEKSIYDGAAKAVSYLRGSLRAAMPTAPSELADDVVTGAIRSSRADAKSFFDVLVRNAIATGDPLLVAPGTRYNIGQNNEFVALAKRRAGKEFAKISTDAPATRIEGDTRTLGETLVQEAATDAPTPATEALVDISQEVVTGTLPERQAKAAADIRSLVQPVLEQYLASQDAKALLADVPGTEADKLEAVRHRVSEAYGASLAIPGLKKALFASSTDGRTLRRQGVQAALSHPAVKQVAERAVNWIQENVQALSAEKIAQRDIVRAMGTILAKAFDARNAALWIRELQLPTGVSFGVVESAVRIGLARHLRKVYSDAPASAFPDELLLPQGSKIPKSALELLSNRAILDTIPAFYAAVKADIDEAVQNGDLQAAALRPSAIAFSDMQNADGSLSVPVSSVLIDAAASHASAAAPMAALRSVSLTFEQQQQAEVAARAGLPQHLQDAVQSGVTRLKLDQPAGAVLANAESLTKNSDLLTALKHLQLQFKKFGLDAQAIGVSWFSAAAGYYSATTDRMHLNPLLTNDSFVRNLIHEATHAITEAKLKMLSAGDFSGFSPAEFLALLELGESRLAAIEAAPADLRDGLNTASTFDAKFDALSRYASTTANPEATISAYYGLLNDAEFISEFFARDEFKVMLSNTRATAQQLSRSRENPNSPEGASLLIRAVSALKAILTGKKVPRTSLLDGALNKAIEVVLLSDFRGNRIADIRPTARREAQPAAQPATPPAAPLTTTEPPSSEAAVAVDAAVDNTLSDSDKAEAATELGHPSWTTATAKLFRETFADWVAGIKTASAKLTRLFKRVASVVNAATLSATMVFSPVSPTFRVGSPVELSLPPVQIEETVREYDPAPAMDLRTPDEKPFRAPAIIAPLPQVPTELPAGLATATPPGVRVSAPSFRKAANFGDHSASANIRKLADWVVDQGDHNNAPFLLADKANGTVFVFDGAGKAVAKAPALFGKDFGDILRGDSFAGGKKITPAGRFEATPETDAELGNTVDFLDQGDSAIAIHRLYLGTPSEKRPERLESSDPAQKRISYGCINVSEAMMDGTIAPLFENGGAVYILPETRKGVSTFRGFEEAGIRPSFAGVRSNMEVEQVLRLVQARNLAGEAKVDTDLSVEKQREIWKETGWLLGPDKRWRFEINDFAADIRSGARKKIDRNTAKAGGTLEFRMHEFLDHPELYARYPKIKDMRVYVEPIKDYAFFDPDNFSITLNESLFGGDGTGTKEDWEKEQREITLHEIQHAIQNIEGFPPGSNVDANLSLSLRSMVWSSPELSKLWGKARAAEKKAKDLSYLDYNLHPIEFTALKAKVNRARDVAEQAFQQKAKETFGDKPDVLKRLFAYLMYQRRFGEIEAKLVSRRANLLPEDSAPNFPLDDITVPREDWIILRGPGTSFSVKPPEGNMLRESRLTGTGERRIAGPALRNPDGSVFRGKIGQTHAQIKVAAAQAGEDFVEAEHVFTDDEGNVLTRAEAYPIAKAAGQLNPDGLRKGDGGSLESQDLLPDAEIRESRITLASHPVITNLREIGEEKTRYGISVLAPESGGLKRGLLQQPAAQVLDLYKSAGTEWEDARKRISENLIVDGKKFPETFYEPRAGETTQAWLNRTGLEFEVLNDSIPKIEDPETGLLRPTKPEPNSLIYAALQDTGLRESRLTGTRVTSAIPDTADSVSSAISDTAGIHSAVSDALRGLPPDVRPSIPGALDRENAPAFSPKLFSRDNAVLTRALKSVRERNTIPQQIKDIILNTEYMPDTREDMVAKAQEFLLSQPNSIEAWEKADKLDVAVRQIAKRMAAMEAAAVAEELGKDLRDPGRVLQHEYYLANAAEMWKRDAEEGSQMGQAFNARRWAGMLARVGNGFKIMARLTYTQPREKTHERMLGRNGYVQEIKDILLGSISEAFDIAGRKAVDLSYGIAALATPADVSFETNQAIAGMLRGIFEGVDAAKEKARRADPALASSIVSQFSGEAVADYTSRITDILLQSFPAPFRTPATRNTPPMQEVEKQVRALVSEQLQSVLRENKDITPEPKTIDWVARKMLEVVTNAGLAKSIFDNTIAKLRENMPAYVPELHLGVAQFLDTNPQFDTNRATALTRLVQDAVSIREEIGKSKSDRFATVESILSSLRTAMSKDGAPLTAAQEQKLLQVATAVSRSYEQEVERVAKARLEALAKAEESRKEKYAMRETGAILDESTIIKLAKLVNMGALRNERFYNTLAPRFGLPAWDEAYAAELEKKYEKAQELPEGFLRNEALIKLNTEVVSKHWKEAATVQGAKGKWAAALHAAETLWMAGVLSRPSTQVANAAYTAIQAAVESVATSFGNAAALAAQGRWDAALPGLIEGATTAFRTYFSPKAWSEFRAALTSGTTQFRSEKLEELGLGEGFYFHTPDTSSTYNALLSTTGNALAASKYVFRMMGAFDALNSSAAMEGRRQQLLRYMGAIDHGLSGKALEDFVNRASNEAEFTRQNLQPKLDAEQAAGYYGTDPKQVALQRKRRETELMDREFYSTGQTNLSRQYAAFSTMNNDPYGLPGYIITQTFGMLNRKFPLFGRAFGVAFPRTLSNMINHMLNWSPFGFIRAAGLSATTHAEKMTGDAGLGRFSTAKVLHGQADRWSPDHFAQLFRATAGSLMLSVVALALSGADDEEEGKTPKFTVTGAGPEDYGKLGQIYETKRNLPTSVTINAFGKSFSLKYQDISFVTYPLLVAGMLSDQRRYGGTEKADANGTWMAMGMVKALAGLTEKNMLAGFKDVLTIFSGLSSSDPNKAAKGEAALKRLLFRPVSGIANPGLVDWATRTVTGRIPDRTTWEGAMLAASPVGVFTNKPRLNALGEPVAQDFFDPTTIRFGGFGEGHPVFSPLVAAGLYLPVASDRQIEDPKKGDPKNDYKRKMTDEEVYYYRASFGQEMGRLVSPEIAQRYAQLVRENPKHRDELQKELTSLGSRAKEYAIHMVITGNFKEIDRAIQRVHRK